MSGPMQKHVAGGLGPGRCRCTWTGAIRISPPHRVCTPGLTLVCAGIAALADVGPGISYPPPSGHRALPRADEQVIGQVEQPEQRDETADGSQDTYDHRGLLPRSSSVAIP